MKHFLILFAFISLFASCEQLASTQEQVTREELEKQRQLIDELVAAAGCNEAAQCRFIGIGSKACGGPQGYLIYSSNVDEEKLKKMVERYNATEAAYNEQNGIMSDCSIPAEPQQLDCAEGNCVEIE